MTHILNIDLFINGEESFDLTRLKVFFSNKTLFKYLTLKVLIIMFILMINIIFGAYLISKKNFYLPQKIFLTYIFLTKIFSKIK